MKIAACRRAFSLIAFASALTLAAMPAAFAAQSEDVASAIAWAKQELATPIVRTPGMKGAELLKYQEQQRINAYLGSCERGSTVRCDGLAKMREEALALDSAQKSVSEASLAEARKTGACGGKSTAPECLVLRHLDRVCAAGDQSVCDRLVALTAPTVGAAPTIPHPEISCAPQNLTAQNRSICALLPWLRLQCQKGIQSACGRLAELTGEVVATGSAKVAPGATTEASAPPASPTKSETPEERWKRIQEERQQQAAVNSATPPTATPPVEPAAPAAPNKPASSDADAASKPAQPAPAATTGDGDLAAAKAWAKAEIAEPIDRSDTSLTGLKSWYPKWTRQQALIKYLNACEDPSNPQTFTGCGVVESLYRQAVADGEPRALSAAAEAGSQRAKAQ